MVAWSGAGSHPGIVIELSLPLTDRRQPCADACLSKSGRAAPASSDKFAEFCEAKLGKLNEVQNWVAQYKQFWEHKLDALDNYLNKTQKNSKKKN